MSLHFGYKYKECFIQNKNKVINNREIYIQQHIPSNLQKCIPSECNIQLYHRSVHFSKQVENVIYRGHFREIFLAEIIMPIGIIIFSFMNRYKQR